MSDEEVLEKVYQIVDCSGVDDWARELDIELDMHTDNRYAGDPDYIGTLADGRHVWVGDASRSGADQYTIIEVQDDN